MRRLATLAALLWLSGAHADDPVRADPGAAAAQKHTEAGRAAPPRSAAAPTAQEPAVDADANGGAAARARTEAKADPGAAERDWLSKDDFDVKGKAVKATRGTLTLNRDEAGPVKLHVGRETKIEVDGKQAPLSQIRPGDDVKASFNLQGDRPVAVEIQAKSGK